MRICVQIEQMTRWNMAERIKQRDRRRGRRTEGLCVTCGLNVALDGYAKCEKCLERVRGYYITYNSKHPEKRRDWRREQKQIVLDHYGARCVCCGESNKDFLSIDHMNNDGAAHRREIGSGAILRWLILNNFPPGFQILCYNCNMAKQFCGGVCPHQVEVTTTA